MHRFLKRLSDVTIFIASIVLFAMMVHVSADVVMKYAFSQPIAGTLEIVSTYYMVAAVFLPLAVVELTRASIAVDVAYRFMPRAMKAFCMLLVLAGSATVYFVLAHTTWGPAVRSWQINEQMMGQVYVTVWPSRFVLPVSFVLAGLVCLAHLYGFLTSREVRKRLLAPHETVEPADG